MKGKRRTAAQIRVDQLEYALELVMFAVTDDAENNGGRVDRLAVYELVRGMGFDGKRPNVEDYVR